MWFDRTFTWDDREDPASFTPCDFCKAYEYYPVKEDSTTEACDHCDYAIVLYCLEHNV